MIELHLDVQMPEEVRDHLQQAEALREKAQQTQKAAAAEQATVVHNLRASGISLRDAGRVLGLSQQRIVHLDRQ